MALCGVRVERRLTPLGPSLLLFGDLDDLNAVAFDAVLSGEIARAGGDVGLDLSGLDFVGFVGVDLLIAASHRMAAAGRRLRVVATNRVVDRIFEIAGVELTTSPDTGERFIPSRRARPALERSAGSGSRTGRAPTHGTTNP